jgi:hypothetical protein
MVRARHPNGPAMTRHDFGNPLIVGGHDHRVQAAHLPYTLADVDNHRLAAQVGQRLAGEAGRIVSGGDDRHR